MRVQKQLLQSNREAGYIEQFVIQTTYVPGDCVEVGVYRGGSAEYILFRMNEEKKLYLFDPFDAFRDLTKEDSLEDFPTLGDSDYKDVKDYFSNNPRVEVIRGYFPESAESRFNNMHFSFVHLDIDAYNDTLKSLTYLYPRMNPGGVILIHDYTHDKLTVKRVCDEFMQDKPEKIQLIDTSQAIIVKQ